MLAAISALSSGLGGTLVFRRHDATISYAPIVGTGANACTLHYIDNSAELKDGDLLLVDAGCEYDYYASDITRTMPVNGRFTPEQRALIVN